MDDTQNFGEALQEAIHNFLEKIPGQISDCSITEMTAYAFCLTDLHAWHQGKENARTPLRESIFAAYMNRLSPMSLLNKQEYFHDQVNDIAEKYLDVLKENQREADMLMLLTVRLGYASLQESFYEGDADMPTLNKLINETYIVYMPVTEMFLRTTLMHMINAALGEY